MQSAHGHAPTCTPSSAKMKMQMSVSCHIAAVNIRAQLLLVPSAARVCSTAPRESFRE
jgi:hypothetical protein